MKTAPLCILLILIIILLLVQAAEYNEDDKEVNARDILTHIEKGDDIYLYKCRIIGELDISKINLKSVPNPAFNETVSELFDDQRN